MWVCCFPTVFLRPFLSIPPYYKSDWPTQFFAHYLRFMSSSAAQFPIRAGWPGLKPFWLQKNQGAHREKICTMHCNYGVSKEPGEVQTRKLAKPCGARLRLAWLGPPGWPSGPPPAGQRAQNISPTLVSTLVLTLVFIVRFAYSCPQF